MLTYKIRYGIKRVQKRIKQNSTFVEVVHEANDCFLPNDSYFFTVKLYLYPFMLSRGQRQVL
jgi:hypothetical protein